MEMIINQELIKKLINFLEKERYSDIQRFPLRNYPSNSISTWINEIKVLGRFFIKGNNIFSISLRPSLYQALYPNKQILFLRDCFFLNKPFPIEIWEEFFPGELIVRWQRNSLLREDEQNKWRFVYRIVPYDNYLFVTSRFDRREPHFTFLSYDSLYFASFLACRLKALSFKGNSALDICCGVGIQAFIASSFCQNILGIDINPNAVDLANINGSINNFSGCIFRKGRLFEGLSNRFDLIISNPPFIYLKNEDVAMTDSDGKEPFGVGITLEIIKALPDFLNEEGRGFMITRSPVFNTGDYLFNELPKWLPRDFGYHYYYISDSISPLDLFERERGIMGYRHVIIEILKGNDHKFVRSSYWHRNTSLF